MQPGSECVNTTEDMPCALCVRCVCVCVPKRVDRCMAWRLHSVFTVSAGVRAQVLSACAGWMGLPCVCACVCVCMCVYR